MRSFLRRFELACALRLALCSAACLSMTAVSAVAVQANGPVNEQVVVDPIHRIRRSTVIERPCAVVWPYLNDFSGIGKWYQAFRSARYLSGPKGQVGEIREIVRRSNGQLVQEKLIYLDPDGMELAYSHVLNPPARDIVTLVSLSPLPQGQCLVSWSNTFRLKPGQSANQATGFFTNAYRNVLQGLKTHVESQTVEPPGR